MLSTIFDLDKLRDKENWFQSTKQSKTKQLHFDHLIGTIWQATKQQSLTR